MRSKKAIKNTLFAIIAELIAIICGLIIPRLILSEFGSKYNGITTSISQFLNFAIILRAGIAGATRAALYKPLAQNDTKKINAIMSATNKHMKKIGIILGIFIIIFSCFYPFLLRNQFNWIFSSSLFLIIGISTFAQTFFGITYTILLQADQKYYIFSIVHIFTNILNLIIAITLIKLGASIHIVKLGSAIAFTLYPIILNIYVKKKYNLNLSVLPDNNSISQRWDAFFHQVANFVMFNTDTIILTIFANIKEVSVYGIYALVVSNLKKIVLNITNGIEAAFGNMIAKKESILLKENFSIIEFLIFYISTLIYTITIVLIIPFVSIYTKGVTDVNYIRPIFAYILVIAYFFNSIRLPYQLIVQANGNYKETKKGAILEPIINITISLVFVIKYGLVGVAIGTLCAIIFRTIQYSYFVSKHIIKGAFVSMMKKILVSLIEATIIINIYNFLNIDFATNYFGWVSNLFVIGIISVMVVTGISLLFYKSEINNIYLKLKNIILKSNQ